jgi:large subunit ribosomal protein L18e
MVRTVPTNPYLKNLIIELRKKSLEEKAPIWKDVAEKLEKPRRKKVEVNLSDINRHAKENETILVPGVVLANGSLTKQLTIAAWRFSKNAIKKIKESGSKIMTIEELMKVNPKGSNVRIMV